MILEGGGWEGEDSLMKDPKTDKHIKWDATQQFYFVFLRNIEYCTLPLLKKKEHRLETNITK